MKSLNIEVFIDMYNETERDIYKGYGWRAIQLLTKFHINFVHRVSITPSQQATRPSLDSNLNNTNPIHFLEHNLFKFH
jgi:hypothetical protein